MNDEDTEAYLQLHYEGLADLKIWAAHIELFGSLEAEGDDVNPVHRVMQASTLPKTFAHYFSTRRTMATTSRSTSRSQSWTTRCPWDRLLAFSPS